MNLIRIATRRSPLALAQAQTVAERLASAFPDHRFELVEFTSAGDRTQGPLASVGGKGLFTEALEAALQAGQVALAVHSAKDVPAELVAGTGIAACPTRADPRDVLITRDGVGLDALPDGAALGTSSGRRAAQARAHRPDLRIVPLRGNVQTRLEKVLAGEIDATMLAMAGLIRSGLIQRFARHCQALDPRNFIPAAGQGILAIQARLNDPAGDIAAGINDPDAHAALDAERAVVRALGADCTAPVGVYVRRGDDGWIGSAFVARPDSAAGESLSVAADAQRTAADVAERLLAELNQRGAQELLRPR